MKTLLDIKKQTAQQIDGIKAGTIQKADIPTKHKLGIMRQVKSIVDNTIKGMETNDPLQGKPNAYSSSSSSSESSGSFEAESENSADTKETSIQTEVNIGQKSNNIIMFVILALVALFIWKRKK